MPHVIVALIAMLAVQVVISAAGLAGPVLAPIAARATVHQRVVKSVRGGRTTTAVGTLSGGERVEEIARMLGGEAITEAARRHARELLAQAEPATRSRPR